MKVFTLFIIHTVVNIMCGMVPLLAQSSAVLQTENAALTVLKLKKTKKRKKNIKTIEYIKELPACYLSK